MTTIRENRRYFYAVMYFLIACVVAALLTSCSPYAPQAGTSTPTPSPSATAQPSATVTASTTPRPACVIETGYPAGRVNLRRAATRNSAAIDVLHEGERLTVLSPRGDKWMNVLTRDNKAGFIYSRYCVRLEATNR